jgi:TRAP-type mannitol/chloroaromatic compound transport system substrate-binding protein
MKRRHFLQAAGVGLAAPAILSPARAQAPELKWRLTSSFPKSLDILYGAAEHFAKAVAEATDNRFQVHVFPGGEIVKGLEAVDAVSKGTVEMCHTASYYQFAKDPTFAFGTGVPFGLNSRMQNAWQFFGGGMGLLNEFYKKFNVYGIPAGNTGCQMGGWYRKEINSAADLKGLKMRIGGLAGQILARVGVELQEIAVNDINAALEKGTLDACEWVGPYDDERLGLHKVAKFYYYPGWWEGGATLHNFVNLEKWNALPPAYKSIIRTASEMVNGWIQARYDAANASALKVLIENGAVLRPFSREVLETCHKAANETYRELAAANADFKKLHEHMTAFRRDQYLWWQVAEYTFDTHQIRARSRG